MKILLSVEHPAWAHQFRYVYKELTEKGHDVKVVAIKKDVDLELLDAFGIPYEVISDTSGINILEKGMIFLKTTLKIFQTSNKFRPDMYIGRASPMMAINSFIFRKPHIIFEDSEPCKFCLLISKLFSDVIITPTCFKTDLGKKHIKVEANKELFYLHPNYFNPNPNTLLEMGLTTDEKYIFIRFVAWKAHHDIGRSGLTNKIGIVKELEKYGRVIISSEGELPEELKHYQITVAPEKIHDLLYYATMFFTDSQTMTTEAGILGTPTVRCNSFVGINDMGNFVELESKYGLIFNCKSEVNALDIGVRILNLNNVKEKWAEKRDYMLQEKIDVTEYMLKFILLYPKMKTYK